MEKEGLISKLFHQLKLDFIIKNLNIKQQVGSQLLNMLKELLFGLALLMLITADSIEVTNLDFVQSIASCNVALLQRVQKRVDLQYGYQLVGDNVYRPYPEMNIIFQLPFPQYIKVLYNLNILSSGAANLQTHLMVDGVENRDFRGHFSSTNWHPFIFRSGEIYLEAGKHQIIIEYRTSNTAVQGNLDWNSATFRVDYFKEQHDFDNGTDIISRWLYQSPFSFIEELKYNSLS